MAGWDAPEFELSRAAAVHRRHRGLQAAAAAGETRGLPHEQAAAEAMPEPLALYRRLRGSTPRRIRLSARRRCAVLSSSPERFLSVGRDRWAEPGPSRARRRRGETWRGDNLLAEALGRDEKSRAENMMITDLLRNDLGSVCEIGSVHVAGLIEVETTRPSTARPTVRGRLREGRRPPTACGPASRPGR